LFSLPVGREVAVYVQAQRRAGLARQTVINQVNLLHGVCVYAVRRGWIFANPVVGVERPRAGNRDPDIRFLSIEELEALLRAVPDDALGRMDRALYLTAAMTGLRRASSWRFAGRTSTGAQGSSVCAEASVAASSARRSRAVPVARCRLRIA